MAQNTIKSRKNITTPALITSAENITMQNKDLFTLTSKKYNLNDKIII